MVNGRKKAAGNSSSPAGSASGKRKLTLSCSRCRASKLKCDRKEPCVSISFCADHGVHLTFSQIECIKRDIGHLCTKDERQPRAKRAKKEAPSTEDIRMSVYHLIQSSIFR